MTHKPKRRFQIHLSTAIALMLVSSGLLWQDLSWRNTQFLNAMSDDSIIGEVLARGWPVQFENQFMYYKAKSRYPLPPLDDEQPSFIFFRAALIADIIFAIAVIGSIGALLEWLIRRREARKQ